MTIVRVGSISLQIQREETRRTFVERLIDEIEKCVQRVVMRCIEEVLEGELTEILGRGWYERRGEGKERQVAAQCNKCETQNAREFRRDGHYQRYLDTRWGRLRISVPQVECVCGGQVSVTYQTLRARQRIWDDLEGEIRERCGWGMSLRWIKEVLDARLRSSVGLSTLNQRVRQLSQLVSDWHNKPLAEVPPVVRVDGIWVTQMITRAGTKSDRLGRQRPIKQAKKRPILVAQGIWPSCGRQEMVAWVLGQAEDEQSWESLLTQMFERGVCPDSGLRLLVGDGAAGLEQARRTVYWDVPFQRCVFHKLRNIARDIIIPEHMQRQVARAYKRHILRKAARVWQAPDAHQARRRQRSFCRRWETEQPAVVATMDRDFESTLSFYHVQAVAAEQGESWPARTLRTTSPLEREMRAFRRRFSAALIFHSRSGLEAVFHQLLSRRTAAYTQADPCHWHLALERALAATNSIS